MSEKKRIPASGAGAVKILLKNIDQIRLEKKDSTLAGDAIYYLFDVFYPGYAGTLNVSVLDEQPVMAVLDLQLARPITFDSDAGLKKLVKKLMVREGLILPKD